MFVLKRVLEKISNFDKMTAFKVSEKQNIVFKGSLIHVNQNQKDYLNDF